MRSRFAPAAVALALAAALAGCGTPGGSSNDTAEKADKEAKQSVAKPDPSKAGDVTLTVWDQEVRGGQRPRSSALNAAFQEKYPNVTIKRVAKSFRPQHDAQARRLRRQGARRRAGQPGPAGDGELVKGGLLRPLDPTRRPSAGTPLLPAAARPQQVLLRRREFGDGEPLRAVADGRDRGRLLQQGQGVRAAEDAGRLRAVARRGQAGRRPPDPVRQPREVARHPRVRDRAGPDRRQAGRARLRLRRTARPSTRPSSPTRPRKLRVGRRRTTSRRTSTARATTRPGSSSPRARATS